MRYPYWLTYHHWRYLVKYRLGGFWHRARHGWAPVDVWSFDKHLGRVLAGGLRHLAATTQGHPGWIMNEYDLGPPEGEDAVSHAVCMDAWRDWLLDKAKWFEWYYVEELNLSPGMTDAQRLAALDLWDKQYVQFFEAVLPNFVQHFDSLWD